MQDQPLLPAFGFMEKSTWNIKPGYSVCSIGAVFSEFSVSDTCNDFDQFHPEYISGTGKRKILWPAHNKIVLEQCERKVVKKVLLWCLAAVILLVFQLKTTSFQWAPDKRSDLPPDSYGKRPSDVGYIYLRQPGMWHRCLMRMAGCCDAIKQVETAKLMEAAAWPLGRPKAELRQQILLLAVATFQNISDLSSTGTKIGQRRISEQAGVC